MVDEAPDENQTPEVAPEAADTEEHSPAEPTSPLAEDEQAAAGEAPPESALRDEAGEGFPETPSEVSPGAPMNESAAGAAAVVEALLFASGKPVPIERLAEAAELSPEEVEQAVAHLETRCAEEGRGVRLDRAAGGVRLVTRPEHDYPVRRLLGLDGRTKLSMAALETLAIVAYRQPVTGPEVAELRGVNSSSSLRTLLDRKLITTAGRKEVVGTPFLYKTTKEFLVHFGISTTTELPKLEELEAIYGLDAPPPNPAQTELFPTLDETGAPEGDQTTEPTPPEEPN